jgi:hypothetical protein
MRKYGPLLTIAILLIVALSFFARPTPAGAQVNIQQLFEMLGNQQQQQQQQQQQRQRQQQLERQRQQQQQQQRFQKRRYPQRQQRQQRNQPQRRQTRPAQRQPQMPPSSGDPLVDALKQIDLSKQIAAKSAALQQRLGNVIYTIKLYQALNGGIWYQLGRQLNDIHKLNSRADAQWVRRFIAANKTKRVAGQSALKHVEVSAVDDIQDQNHTIANNNGKIQVLRQSVSAYVNALNKRGGFNRLVQNQNIPLNAMMDAYLRHIGNTMTTMESAALVFQDMSGAYRRAVGDMSGAIQAFDQQSGTVGAEVAKQAAIIAIQIINVTKALDQANDVMSKIMVGIQGAMILKDLASVAETLENHQKVFRWFDANSKSILAASRGARSELKASVKTMMSIRPALMKSWKSQMVVVRRAAAKQRRQTINFERQLAAMSRQAKQQAQTTKQVNMAELNTLLKKPRSLRSRRKK